MIRSISDIAQELNATGLTQQQSTLLIELITAKVAQEKHLPTTALPDDWAPNEKHYVLAKEKYNKDRFWVDSIAYQMRNWARSRGEKRASWDGTFRTFMQKAVEPRINGSGYSASTGRLGDYRA